MTSTVEPCLGWIGLGSMGRAMAINIQRHLKQKQLPPLKYWNRTISRGDAVEDEGGIPSQSIAELSQNSDVVFISVSDDKVLEEVIASIIQSGPITSKIFVDTTTVHPSTTTSMAKLIEAQSGIYIGAPVFGATPVAEAGQLVMAVAGPAAAVQTISPFLKGVIARSVIEVGDEPHKALLLKTTSNYITGGFMYLLSEAHVLAAKTGLPADALEALIEQNLGSYAHGVSKRLTSGVYCPAKGQSPYSGLELGIKDVGHGVNMGKDADVRMRVGELYLDAAKEAKAFGDETGRKMDSSSVYGVVRQRAGLKFETEIVEKRDRKDS